MIYDHTLNSYFSIIILALRQHCPSCYTFYRMLQSPTAHDYFDYLGCLGKTVLFANACQFVPLIDTTVFDFKSPITFVSQISEHVRASVA